MDKKKLAAATAAVFAYIKTSEEAGAFALQQGEQPDMALAGQQQSVQQANLWGISGRQAHMQANSMMQMRLFK